MAVNAFGWPYFAEYYAGTTTVQPPPRRVPLNMPALVYMRKREGRVTL